MGTNVKRRDLEEALAGIPAHPAPRPEWEQYRTPNEVALGLLLEAQRDGAIAGRRVVDLGCGTGLFTIAAGLMGAGSVLGVDIDEAAVQLAREGAARAGLAQASFEVADLGAWHRPGAFDTAIMNPPFGAQAANRHADRLFLERAAECVQPAGCVYFLAQERTERFLDGFAKRMGAQLERVAAWDYPLPRSFAFHEREVVTLRVGGYRMQFQTGA